MCFPELDEIEREHLAKRSIRETFKAIAEMGAIWFWPVETSFRNVQEVNGLHILKDAYAENKGVIVIGPHLGNWEIMGPYLSGCGCGQVNVMYQAPKEPELDKLIYSARGRGNVKMLATNNKGVGKVLVALRRGELVGILPDQVPAVSGGRHVHFFGQEALTMTLLSRLLQKTGARAVLAYARRVRGPEGEGFQVNFREISNQIYAEHILDSLQALNDAIESAVREVPEQYQWEYKRFKRQPEGKPNVY